MDNKKNSFLDKINDNKYKIILIVLMILVFVGAIISIVLGSYANANESMEKVFIFFVSYLCMIILGILLILYFISVGYGIYCKKHKEIK